MRLRGDPIQADHVVAESGVLPDRPELEPVAVVLGVSGALLRRYILWLCCEKCRMPASEGTVSESRMPARAEITGVPLPKFNLALLGRFELSGPAGTIELPNKKLAGLLTYLACTAPEPQSREKLATLLWGSHFETQA